MITIPSPNPSITLRALSREDASHLAAVANSPLIAQNVRDAFPHPYGIHNAIEYIEKVVDHAAPKQFGIWSDGSFAGATGFFPQDDVYRFSAEIGYFLGPSFWGKGIATDAVATLVDYIFQHTETLKVFARVFDYNKASMRVLEKAGFHYEAVFRKNVFKQGTFWDEHQYCRFHPTKRL